MNLPDPKIPHPPKNPELYNLILNFIFSWLSRWEHDMCCFLFKFYRLDDFEDMGLQALFVIMVDLYIVPLHV